MKRIRPQTSLRFKLFFSYTLVTALAFLLIEVVLVSIAMLFISSRLEVTPEAVQTEISDQWLPLAQPYLEDSPQNRSHLQVVLKKFRGFVVLSESLEISETIHLDLQSQHYLTLIFLDQKGHPIDSIPHPDADQQLEIPLEDDLRQEMLANPGRIHALMMEAEDQVAIVSAVQRYYTAQLEQRISQSESMQTLIANVFQDQNSVENVFLEEQGNSYGIVPIPHSHNEKVVVGAILWQTKLEPWDIVQYRDFLRTMSAVLLVTLVLSAIIGTVFGVLSSRTLVRRLSSLSGVINHWSAGNFAAKINDSGQDELHTVAVELNTMSDHFESLLLEKQEMSIIRERNRLARDLHDSVKQDTFGASAQLAAARALIRSKPDQAIGHMEEANNILDRVRSELTSLIHELYPAHLANHSLPDSIQRFVNEWKKIYGLEVKIHILSYQGLPKTVEKTFYLILQEAFSNVARHSKASTVEVFLKQSELSAFLMISDNGCGMNVDSTELGIGMKSMNERAKLMGGTLDVISASSEGTCIRIEVPLEGK